MIWEGPSGDALAGERIGLLPFLDRRGPGGPVGLALAPAQARRFWSEGPLLGLG